MSRSAKQDRRQSDEGQSLQLTPAQQAREMLESFAVAFMLMLLMRNCLGENYQIPTGSMAPTLQGRHMDVLCAQCGYQYRTGASIENQEHGEARGEVTGTTCPICRFPMQLDKRANPNERSFSGDRIIVSKLAYWVGEPERWDVIVFKCPADAKINYIKRLVGLPGETLEIRHGDIFVVDPATLQEPAEKRRATIARKPPDKVLGMLQLVDDSRYIGEALRGVNWPSRWVAVTRDSGAKWRQDESGAEFAVEAGEQESWLRYRHLIPRPGDWDAILDGAQPNLVQYNGAPYEGMLITDYYAYNDAAGFANYATTEATNWVGDLALETQAEVMSEGGELLLDLVEGGAHFTCRINLASGEAQLAIGNKDISFRNAAGEVVATPRCQTPVRGPGTYRLRFANVDDQLFLWVNDEVMAFDGSTMFDSRPDAVPEWSPEDGGDLRPLGIGARQAAIHFSQLRVLRDVYYLAASVRDPRPEFWHSDYSPDFGREEVYDVLSNPQSWSSTGLFKSRRSVIYALTPEQFFPLGDNSPQSKDARLWSYIDDHGRLVPPAAVDRSLMIGKAVFVYWPHAWYLPALPLWPLVPNYQRIGMIR
ncbi:MAG: signal peptidase I [Pirellulaceae bacterium]